MGHVYSEIELGNPKEPSIRSIKVNCLVDTEALYLVIPESLQQQLKLEVLETRQVTVADGSSKIVPYVGPLICRFENRRCFVGAIVMGDEVLLGAVPMEDMDLVVIPSIRKLMVNPNFPNIPHALVK